MQIKKATAFLFPKKLLRGHIIWILIFLLAPISFYTPEAVRHALTLCIESIIPAVFPFVLISSLISIGGLSYGVGRLFYPIFHPIFKCSHSVAAAIALGFLCGYPVGASVAAEAYDKGEISKAEFENTLCFINNPSPAFVIGFVGTSLLGNSRIGAIIYLSVCLSAVLVGALINIRPNDSNVLDPLSRTSSSPTSISLVITEALMRSGASMINICTCIVTFFSVSALICKLIPATPQIVKAFVCGIFEISSGVRAASELDREILAPTICAAICSWSGISVQMQILSVCRGRGIKFSKFIISKAMQAVISSILTYLLILLTDPISAPAFSYRPDLLRIIRTMILFLAVAFTVIAIRLDSSRKHRTK